MKSIKIIRLDDNGMQTLGAGFVFDGIEKIFEFKTLELPWKGNATSISCIPVGVYKIKKFISPKHGICFLFFNVRDRTMIEIHSGNYYTDILGCILPGAGYSDINNDGLLDVHSSKKTMKKLLEIMPDEFELTIT